MAKKLYPEESVQAIADAIRTKTGKTDKMTVGEMSGEIEGIEKGWSIDDIASLNISGNIVVNVSVRSFSFAYNNKITAVKALSGCDKIFGSGFRSCEGIASLDGVSLVSIGAESFHWAYPLDTVILRSSNVCALGSVSAFGDTALASGTGYIYVPSALVDSYKTATNWTTYASQFRALEDYTVDGTIDGELDESKI